MRSFVTFSLCSAIITTTIAVKNELEPNICGELLSNDVPQEYLFGKFSYDDADENQTLSQQIENLPYENDEKLEEFENEISSLSNDAKLNKSIIQLIKNMQRNSPGSQIKAIDSYSSGCGVGNTSTELSIDGIPTYDTAENLVKTMLQASENENENVALNRILSDLKISTNNADRSCKINDSDYESIKFNVETFCKLFGKNALNCLFRQSTKGLDYDFDWFKNNSEIYYSSYFDEMKKAIKETDDKKWLLGLYEIASLYSTRLENQDTKFNELFDLIKDRKNLIEDEIILSIDQEKQATALSVQENQTTEQTVEESSPVGPSVLKTQAVVPIVQHQQTAALNDANSGFFNWLWNKTGLKK